MLGIYIHFQNVVWYLSLVTKNPKIKGATKTSFIPRKGKNICAYVGILPEKWKSEFIKSYVLAKRRDVIEKECLDNIICHFPSGGCKGRARC